MTVSAQPVVVGTRRVRAAIDGLLAPDAREWDKADEVAVPLEPTPLDRQPSAYVRVAWRDRPRGDTSEVLVRTLTNAKALAIRLEWAAARPHRSISDFNVYPDACAVLFPVDGVHLEHDTMGSEKHPAEAWHWRAGTDEPFVITATGLGTTERRVAHGVQARARWAAGRWQVVLARPIDGEGAPLARGSSVPVAFAIWSGSAGERAGLKSHSRTPHELKVGE